MCEHRISTDTDLFHAAGIPLLSQNKRATWQCFCLDDITCIYHTESGIFVCVRQLECTDSNIPMKMETVHSHRKKQQKVKFSGM